MLCNNFLQDVVTANPDSWSFDPFTLTREGDKLLGRGVTDCLGHVALLTELFRQLAVHKPPLKATVMGVFIANEENSTVRRPGVLARKRVYTSSRSGGFIPAAGVFGGGHCALRQVRCCICSCFDRIGPNFLGLPHAREGPPSGLNGVGVFPGNCLHCLCSCWVLVLTSWSSVACWTGASRCDWLQYWQLSAVNCFTLPSLSTSV